MAKISTEDLLATFEEMTILELKDFKDAFEERFDVTAAAAPVMMAMATGAEAGEPAEEQTEFDLILTSAGDKKIQVIKEVRSLTSLGLKEAKEVVDSAPKPILEGVSKEDVEAGKEKIEAAGGSVEIK